MSGKCSSYVDVLYEYMEFRLLALKKSVKMCIDKVQAASDPAELIPVERSD